MYTIDNKLQHLVMVFYPSFSRLYYICCVSEIPRIFIKINSTHIPQLITKIVNCSKTGLIEYILFNSGS